MKYSVIIPIYNAEKTLQRCLDSLLPQLNNNVEVLLVNDGSTDTSREICKEYVDKCRLFRYFEQSNSGVSVARNRGLENATGDYILFIDSDDYLDDKYFETIDYCINQDKPQFLLFGAAFVNRTQRAEMKYSKNNYSGINAVNLFAELSKKQNMYALWNKVFVRQIINTHSIRFITDISIGEDAAFIFNYILNVDSVSIIDSILYYVDESNTSSLSRRKRTNLYDDLVAAYTDMNKHLENSPIDEHYRFVFNKMLSRAYYRSAYSCFLEISRWNCSNAETKAGITKVCSAYKKNRIKPVGLDSMILSLPVLWKLSLLIVLMLRIKRY